MKSIKKVINLSNYKRALSSRYFSIFTALLMIANYYLAFDLVNIYIFGIILISMFLLLDDLTPTVSQFIFLAVICSEKNSPMYGVSDYYTRIATLVQIGTIILIIAACAVYRFVQAVRAGRFKFTPAFIGVLALSVAIVLNGAFGSEFSWGDFGFGCAVAAAILPTYASISVNITVNDKNISQICFAFFIFSITLILFLLVAVIRAGGNVTDVNAFRDYLQFGWGMWNNLGMFLVISIPPVAYLALKSRASAFYLGWCIVIAVAVLVTTSRQSYVSLAAALPLSYILVLVKSKNKKQNFILTGVAAVIVVAVLCLFGGDLFKKLYNILINGLFSSDGSFSGSGRITFIKRAWENFLNNPLFGAGFYAENMQGAYGSGMSTFPQFYHNVIAQMLGACGIVGLACYLVHIVTLVIAFFKGRSLATTFLGITFLAYIIATMFDNHMFYILSTFIYSSLLPFVTVPAQKEGEGSEKKEEVAAPEQTGENTSSS